jgi:protoporphyrinogen/coproporphyrinogen III oxidase
VGAGLAGLAAAHRLESLGWDVCVLEARGRAGGKHARESLDGIGYEPWPGVLPRVAPAWTELVHELGLAGQCVRTPLAGSLELARVVSRWPLGGLRMRRFALVAHWLGGELDPDQPWWETRLDDRSVADFCQVYLGQRAHREVLEPLFASAFGLDTHETSRQLLFSLLDAACNPALDSLAGAGVLAETLAGKLRDLRLARQVTALDPDRRGVRLRDGSSERGDAVVLAVSADEAARLLAPLAPAASAAFARLRAQPGLVLHAVTDKELDSAGEWRLPRGQGGELASLSVEGRALRLVARPDLAERHGHRPDAELSHFLLEAAAGLLPQLAGRVSAQRLHRFPALPGFGVGHYRALAHAAAGCAGDWCAGPHVEGELASGLRAARAVGAGD